jgi:hypothetical protein
LPCFDPLSSHWHMLPCQQPIQQHGHQACTAAVAPILQRMTRIPILS